MLLIFKQLVKGCVLNKTLVVGGTVHLWSLIHDNHHVSCVHLLPTQLHWSFHFHTDRCSHRQVQFRGFHHQFFFSSACQTVADVFSSSGDFLGSVGGATVNHGNSLDNMHLH